MPELRLKIKFNKNEGLIMSPSELLDLYLSGIPLCHPNGAKVSQSTVKQKIVAAQRQLENFLSIKLNRQEIFETQDFNRQEWMSWGFIKTVYPIMEPKILEGYINEIKQVTYPKDWLSIKNNNDKTKFRNLHLVPNTGGDGATMTNHGFAFSGITPHLGYYGSDHIPNYWRVTYCTGWKPGEIPAELLDAVGKLAAMQLLSITGDLIFGAGIGNQSISIDGISQTYSTTKGGGKGAFAGRIEQYKNELENELARLKAEYVGITFRVV